MEGTTKKYFCVLTFHPPASIPNNKFYAAMTLFSPPSIHISLIFLLVLQYTVIKNFVITRWYHKSTVSPFTSGNNQDLQDNENSSIPDLVTPSLSDSWNDVSDSDIEDRFRIRVHNHLSKIEQLTRDHPTGIRYQSSY